MKMIFKIFIFAQFVSCTSPAPKRSTSSENLITITSTSGDTTGALSLPQFQCPEGTTLQAAVVEVNLQRCLKEYVHRESSHGIVRERICFHTGTKHESRMRMGQKNKIYAALIKKIQYPVAQKNAYVSLNMNHAYYSVEFKIDSPEAEMPSKKEVLQAFQETPLPKKLSLERCECDLTQFSNDECLNRLGPILQMEQTYRYTTPEDLIF